MVTVPTIMPAMAHAMATASTLRAPFLSACTISIGSKPNICLTVFPLPRLTSGAINSHTAIAIGAYCVNSTLPVPSSDRTVSGNHTPAFMPATISAVGTSAHQPMLHAIRLERIAPSAA